ncbi:spermatogenesis-associated protein 20 [Hordeum vulgare]|nr:spermatogenesis-associated protein 20 [Hordeum vulgare]
MVGVGAKEGVAPKKNGVSSCGQKEVTSCRRQLLPPALCFVDAATVAMSSSSSSVPGGSRKPNRLTAEHRPYLLQHVHNPVDWYPWGDEVFEKARKLDIPSFYQVELEDPVENIGTKLVRQAAGDGTTTFVILA